MSVKYRGHIEVEDGKFVIVGVYFDAEGRPFDMNEMLAELREAWDDRALEEKKT